MTVVYFVRHAHSIYTNDEYNRPLSKKGFIDAQKVTQIFKPIAIHAIYSSPYKRAIQTIEGIARCKGLSIKTMDALKERTLASSPIYDFQQAMKQVWENEDYSLEGGESNKSAQQRAVEAFLYILDCHKDKQIVIGTHGNIMTLLLNYFDKAIGFTFWKELHMPAIIRCFFQNKKLIDINILQ